MNSQFTYQKHPGGIRISAPVQTGPRVHPASYTMSTGAFPGVKRPVRGLDNPPPSSAEVKERIKLYIYYTFVAGYRVNFSFTLLFSVRE